MTLRPLLLLLLLAGTCYAGHRIYHRHKVHAAFEWRHDYCDVLVLDKYDPDGMIWLACEEKKSGCPYKYQNGEVWLQTVVGADGETFCTDDYGMPIKKGTK
jgi:hypothetical protein